MSTFDFKKEYKNLYQPKDEPSIIDVPAMKFITVSGKGNPNTCEAYKNAMDVLYSLSYAIKMSYKNGNAPDGFYEYVVAPLEGFWWMDDERFDCLHVTDKSKFCWKVMIRQPEFVTDEYFQVILESVHKKKPEIDLSVARFETITEGLCVQIMHHGIYDDEPANVIKMNEFLEDSKYENDITDTRWHHEIYLGDPRKQTPDKMRTVIRHPVKLRKE